MSSGKLEYTVVIVGDGGVGKTSLTIYLTEGRFEAEYNPTIEDEEYQLLRDQHWRSGDGFVMKTFEDVTSFGEHILKSKDGNEVPIVLCGNKCDLPATSRQVTEVEAKKLCEENEWYYFETSAKKGTNVNIAFETLCKGIIEFNSTPAKEEKPKKKGLFSKIFKRK
ncbi:ras family small GTPase [Naegleria gruberi]|uniref:Ras family small GTPase n=1 Tax=Naegleria gruberi TaxID=5762 RepID=D2VAI0_NAEGR|nr:ras family small GTPase [Naegleria gruberi]EFC45959.1 ras family small GTPase [Naegleria gruberi]|eukprot:XP_002678703.1 ras family small GTPase [Naegleria gruberi strain NEG-M]